MNTAILIPARLESKRFPNKMLAKINGKSLVKHVFDKCKEANYDTYVVTDSMKIYNQFNSDTCFIEEQKYENGTARCAGATKHDFFRKYNQFVNVQGDMFDIRPDMIDKTVWHLTHFPITTLYCDLKEGEQTDVNVVKVIKTNDKALWFSRFVQHYGERHLGVYGYRHTSLSSYPLLSVPQEERVEKLEQLRWLKAGWNIGCVKVDFTGEEVNTMADYEKLLLHRN